MAISEAQAARARYIRTVLAWHDHTQADLARLLGVSQPAANRKLKGIRRFTDDELLAVADAYGLDPGKLLRPPQLAEELGLVGAAPTAGLPRRSKYQSSHVSLPGAVGLVTSPGGFPVDIGSLGVSELAA